MCVDNSIHLVAAASNTKNSAEPKRIAAMHKFCRATTFNSVSLS
jgi:hypothetical protein